MRDDCRHPAHVTDRMPVRQFAKPLQLGHELKYYFLMKIISVRALSFTMRVKTEFETNDAFDYRLGMDCDDLGKEFLCPVIAGLNQERFEEEIDLDWRLFHIEPQRAPKAQNQ